MGLHGRTAIELQMHRFCNLFSTGITCQGCSPRGGKPPDLKLASLFLEYCTQSVREVISMLSIRSPGVKTHQILNHWDMCTFPLYIVLLWATNPAGRFCMYTNGKCMLYWCASRIWLWAFFPPYLDLLNVVHWQDEVGSHLKVSPFKSQLTQMHLHCFIDNNANLLYHCFPLSFLLPT